jgi:hypothetical protein
VEPRRRGSPNAVGRPREPLAGRYHLRRRRLFSAACGRCGVIIDRLLWLAPVSLLGAAEAADL